MLKQRKIMSLWKVQTDTQISIQNIKEYSNIWDNRKILNNILLWLSIFSIASLKGIIILCNELLKTEATESNSWGLQGW